MTDWNSPDEQLSVSTVFKKLVYVFFGIYAWEFVNTMHVERALSLRIQPFRWPQILYFLCRYTLLLGLIGLLTSFSATSQINCQALFTFTQWAGNTTIASASSLLLVRTIAVWNRSPCVIAPMLLLAAGQWALLYYGVTSVSAEWSPQLGECVVTGASPAVLKALYMYTMGFDFIILAATISGLWFTVPGGRGGLWKMLFADGIAYVTLVASANTVPAVLNVLDLNPAMNVIATVPACVTSTIAATRLFRRLQAYTSKDVYVHSTSFMVGVPSAATVGSHRRRWSTTQGKPAFSLSGAQKKTGESKTATESAGKPNPNWENGTGLMPRFAPFPAPARDWEGHGGRIAAHPYASARASTSAEESSLSSVNETTMDKDAGSAALALAELPTFVSFDACTPALVPAPLLRYSASAPRLSKLDVQVEVVEVRESSIISPAAAAANRPPSSARTPASDTTPQRHYTSSSSDVV